MQKNLLLLIIGLLVGIGGTMIFTTYFSTNTPLSTSELFEKKKECANMKNEIQEEQIAGAVVTEVFYSKKENTCLYVLRNHSAKFLIDRFNDNLISNLYSANSEIYCEEAYKGTDLEKLKIKCITESKKFEENIEKLK